MATDIRPELSKRNPYYLPKHRYYELKHFCLQYKDWQREYCDILMNATPSGALKDFEACTDGFSAPTEKNAIALSVPGKNIMLVKISAKKTDEDLWNYILKAVTEGRSYQWLKMQMDIPCGKDMFYDRYRKFFWILSREKQSL